VLYANQPEESVDGFTDAFLLKLAGKVKGLRGADFDSAVKGVKYRAFVAASERAYERAGEGDGEGPGTPTALINGVRINEQYSAVVLYDRSLFGQLMQMVEEDPDEFESLMSSVEGLPEG